jgi:hypothetical protein
MTQISQKRKSLLRQFCSRFQGFAGLRQIVVFGKGGDFFFICDGMRFVSVAP